MDIKVIGSGSSGNAYLISDGSTKVLIDAGLPISQIQEACNYQLTSIDACLISHCHLDHCKSAEAIMKKGINVYSSAGTFKALSLEGHRAKIVCSKQQFTVGTFDVMAFEVEHDAPESLGFLLYSNATQEKLLYFTDTYYLKYKFKGLTHIMSECNYQMDILLENLRNGSLPTVVAPRIIKSHMSLENLIQFLQSNDLSKVQQIHLLHLSNGNSNAEHFKREVQKLTGVEVYVH